MPTVDFTADEHAFAAREDSGRGRSPGAALPVTAAWFKTSFAKLDPG